MKLKDLPQDPRQTLGLGQLAALSFFGLVLLVLYHKDAITRRLPRLLRGELSMITPAIFAPLAP
jgi:hypothetical protein